MSQHDAQPAGACIACGACAWSPSLAGLRDYLTGEPFDIYCCTRCGLGVTSPAPRPAELARYYSDRYRGNRHVGTQSLRSRLRARALERAAARSIPCGDPKRLLDLGAGDASFALLMRDRGWHVSATELDETVVKTLRVAGIDARLASDDAPWPAPFDAITCWHVLEHVDDPVALLARARRDLLPGGVLQVTVPNLASWQARLGGRHWFHLDVPRHLFHFTPQALTRLLERQGFEIVRRSTFAFEYDWFGAIQTPLNALLPDLNVLFDGLTTGRKRRWSGQLIASLFLAPPIGLALLPPTLIAGVLGKGATLTYTCRPRG